MVQTLSQLEQVTKAHKDTHEALIKTQSSHEEVVSQYESEIAALKSKHEEFGYAHETLKNQHEILNQVLTTKEQAYAELSKALTS